mgnify:CR=1 FL=1
MKSSMKHLYSLLSFKHWHLSAFTFHPQERRTFNRSLTLTRHNNPHSSKTNKHSSSTANTKLLSFPKHDSQSSKLNFHFQLPLLLKLQQWQRIITIKLWMALQCTLIAVISPEMGIKTCCECLKTWGLKFHSFIKFSLDSGLDFHR